MRTLEESRITQVFPGTFRKHFQTVHYHQATLLIKDRLQYDNTQGGTSKMPKGSFRGRHCREFINQSLRCSMPTDCTLKRSTEPDSR